MGSPSGEWVGAVSVFLYTDQHPPPICGLRNVFTARSGTGFGTSATSYSSSLSGTATSELNGTLVECFGPAFSRDTDNRVGESTIQVLGKLTSCISNLVYDL